MIPPQTLFVNDGVGFVDLPMLSRYDDGRIRESCMRTTFTQT